MTTKMERYLSQALTTILPSAMEDIQMSGLGKSSP